MRPELRRAHLYQPNSGCLFSYVYISLTLYVDNIHVDQTQLRQRNLPDQKVFRNKMQKNWLERLNMLVTSKGVFFVAKLSKAQVWLHKFLGKNGSRGKSTTLRLGL